MAQKYVDLPGIGQVLLAKRKGSRNLRLTIRPDGVVRVGLPVWAPYAVGIKFAMERTDWIKRHLASTLKPPLKHGDRIGKSFRLNFRHDDSRKTVATRIVANEIRVHSPYPMSHAVAQSAAAAASERALKADAEKLLSLRLKELADKYKFSFRSVKVKKLRSRWGSCSSQSDITLNVYLIQLPWELIDYVILHELTHTQHMNHSQDFWDHMQKILPDTKSLRRQIRLFRPDIIVQ
jgi:predicted metal-dependent hydrolase